MIDNYEYDVALSFAGEDRDYVSEVAAILRSLGLRVFYDEFEQVKLWGKDLYEYLDDIYGKRAKYCVVFISQFYAQKVWPTHERRSAQARALKQHEEYILPARFDDTEIPGIRSTVAYIDLKKLSPADFAKLVAEKIGSFSRQAPPPSPAFESVSWTLRFENAPPTVATLDELENCVRRAALNIDARGFGRTYNFPRSLSGIGVDSTISSSAIKYVKQIPATSSNIKRQETLIIQCTGGFNFIDEYSPSDNRSWEPILDALDFVEDLVFTTIFAKRWFETLSETLGQGFNSCSIGILVNLPKGTILFHNYVPIKTMEVARFSNDPPQIEAFHSFPMPIPDTAESLSPLICRLTNFIFNRFITESGQTFARTEIEDLSRMIDRMLKQIK